VPSLAAQKNTFLPKDSYKFNVGKVAKGSGAFGKLNLANASQQGAPKSEDIPSKTQLLAVRMDEDCFFRKNTGILGLRVYSR
jgi:hypothetical protein